MANTYTTLRGNVISTNETGTHCYMWPEGRKGERVRIKKAEYERIIQEDELEREMAQRTASEEELESVTPEVEAAVEATEESQTTEETQKIAKEMAPKKKRVRKSKDVAFSIHVTTIDNPEETPENLLTLTAKQVDFIRRLSDTNFWENGLDSCIWVDVLCDEIGGQFEGKPMTVGAMISTLCEKGLGVRSKEKINKRTATAFKLTPTGKVVAAKLGLA